MTALVVGSKAVTTDDYVSISDLFGRYCWNVDFGHADAWADLWTEDGVFAGIAPEPIVGREALKAIPLSAFKNSDNGKVRHLVGNLSAEYGETKDTAVAHFYSLTTSWMGPASFMAMALCEVTLVRHAPSWLIKRNDATLLTGKPASAGA